jgi:hypothetical protein
LVAQRGFLPTSPAGGDPSWKTQVAAGRLPLIGLGGLVAPSTVLVCGKAGDIRLTDLDVGFDL